MRNYLNSDTIVALSSAHGKGAISIVRMSGKEVFAIMQKVFFRYAKNSAFDRVQVGLIKDGENIIDEVVCVFFMGPRSFTGEDTVEISAHGNPIIVKNILELLVKNGACLALPGEFSYRAFINGKKDLTQVEAVCSLIAGKTETAVKVALNNISGGFSEKIKAAKQSLTHFLAYLEASMDYPDGDIPFLTQEQKVEEICALVDESQKLIDTYRVSNILQSGVNAVIVGKPNVGKSSLLNAILGKNRAIVTDIAGTTTDSIETLIDCRGVPMTLIDTAGLNIFSEKPIDNFGQQKTREAMSGADILIWVLDASKKIDGFDLQVWDEIKNRKFTGEIFVVLNKIDLPQVIQAEDILKLLPAAKIIKLSAKGTQGIANLLDEMARTLGVLENANEALMINARHWELLTKSQSALNRAKELIISNGGDELASFELRTALANFEEILGINTPHDILDEIFSTFCVGK
jgi:tRNA modification GTPase